jgi:hypothetical protein
MGFLGNLFKKATSDLPEKAKNDGGAYAGAEVARNESGGATGVSGGLGAVNQSEGGGSAQVASANLGIGKFQNRAGETNTGIAGDAQLLKVGINPGSEESGGSGLPVGGELGIGTASAGATVNQSTASLGAQANLIEGALSVGNEEHSLRVGGSVGVGAAGRLHYGDADKDGVRELGFGFDAGPASVDVKTELLGKIWNFFTGGGKKEGDGAGTAEAAPAQVPAAPPVPIAPQVPVAPPAPATRAFPNSPLASDDDVHERLQR